MNPSTRTNHMRPSGRFASAALAVALAALLAGCKSTQTEPSGMSAMAAVPARNEADARANTATWEQRYRTNPDDATTAVNYAPGLRSTGQRAQAAAVLEQALLKNPKNMELLGAYGRALADVG